MGDAAVVLKDVVVVGQAGGDKALHHLARNGHNVRQVLVGDLVRAFGMVLGNHKLAQRSETKTTSQAG